MPQMFPMNWNLMSIIVLFIYLLTTVLLHFTYIRNPHKSPFTILKSNLYLKW